MACPWASSPARVPKRSRGFYRFIGFIGFIGFNEFNEFNGFNGGGAAHFVILNGEKRRMLRKRCD